ncbi:MAG: ligase-associated DNA damage response endonuclease PdeM [Geminicoccaceae bacterium]
MRLQLQGETLDLDPSGALFLPRWAMLVVADLHLEKGGAFARRGSLLPPYDSHATLARLEALVDRLRPDTVVSLGDGFHDRHGGSGISPDLHDRLCALTRPRRWVWVTGNHDPLVPLSLGGAVVPELAVGGLVLRHMPSGETGEIAGHLHPKARLSTRRRQLSCRCFAADEDRLLLPALGSFTGGLNVRDPAIARLFPGAFDAYLLGERRVHRFPHDVLSPEPDTLSHRLRA